VIPQCKAGNVQALAIDDGLADAYLSLSIVTFFYEWDWRGAERAFIRSTLGIEMTGRVATAMVRESDHHGVVIDHFHRGPSRERRRV
jgi:hypothetical protein